MDKLELLIIERECIKEQIKTERLKNNKKLKELITERARLNNAISRAKNYRKQKKI